VGRIAAGWGLAKLSLRVVWSDGSLTALVVLGGLASGAVALAFLAPAAVAYSIDERWLAAIIGRSWRLPLHRGRDVLRGGARGGGLGGARRPRRDGPGGMAVASRCVGAILGWALLLTTVNLVLQALRDRAGLLGNLLLGAAAVAWGLATLLVVPILALEGLGPVGALSRSTALFRERWGEQLAGAASIGVLFAVLGVVPAVVLMAIGFASGSNVVAIALLVVAVLVAVVVGVLGSAARAVFAVALYRYAAGAGATGPFTERDLEGAVLRKS
jgi:hypothetical protein